MSKLCPFCQKANKTVAHFCFHCGGILGELTHPVDFVLNKRYRIVSHLKKGGMANIYKAEDIKEPNRPLAIKEMLEASDNEAIQEKFTEWFEREMHILSNLRHHGIPDFRDHFIDAGRYYLVMEFVPGQNLEDLQKDTAPLGFPEPTVHKWALEISDMLDYLHSQNPPIVHRDVKPSNIIAKTDGRLMLVDFGIARFFTSEKTGTRIGTIGYIAPEHYKGHPEPRSDLYSLGVTLYQLLTGVDPTQEIPFNLSPIQTHKPEMTEFTVHLISKLIALNKEDRFSSAMELLNYLKGEVQPLPQQPSSQQLSIAQLILDGSVEPDLFTAPRPSRIEIASQVMQAPQEEKKAPPQAFGEQWSPRRIYFAAPKTPRKTREAYIGRDNSKMMLVEAGSFIMGSSIDDEALFAFEKPSHPMKVPPFYIDKHPVTVSQFMKFLEDTGYKFKNVELLNPNMERHPVVNVTWYDALFYAAWAGKRLPLEAEWELAARGTDGKKYPWGDTWDPRRLNCIYSGYRNTTPVGIYPRGDTPYGCQDMMGNVWEWTLDNLVGYPYPGPSQKRASEVSVRGGSFRSDKAECRCATRAKRLPSFFDLDLGFRCAISMEEVDRLI